MSQGKPTDVTVKEVKVSFEPVQYRTPLKFGGRVVSSIISDQCRRYCGGTKRETCDRARQHAGRQCLGMALSDSRT
jgi:hypothetical protein